MLESAPIAEHQQRREGVCRLERKEVESERVDALKPARYHGREGKGKRGEFELMIRPRRGHPKEEGGAKYQLELRSITPVLVVYIFT